jgi:hypothetical protein
LFAHIELQRVVTLSFILWSIFRNQTITLVIVVNVIHFRVLKMTMEEFVEGTVYAVMACVSVLSLLCLVYPSLVQPAIVVQIIRHA